LKTTVFIPPLGPYHRIKPTRFRLLTSQLQQKTTTKEDETKNIKNKENFIFLLKIY